MVAVVQNEQRFDNKSPTENTVISKTKCPTTTTHYKEVVVIGNGPSGIMLSCFLAGNWPYYNGLGENSNEMLHYRLTASSATSLSLVQQNLSFLSQGLEGRSSNPVALLFDALNHPQADLGLELPSLLNWRFGPENEIDHVVIGRGPPGGAWQSMDGSLLTISLGCWMELPQMNFRDWNASQDGKSSKEARASVASVAQYYCDYVKRMRLQKYFLSDSVITEVRRVPKKFLPCICDNLKNEVVDDERDDERVFRRHTISEIPLHPSLDKNIRSRRRNLWKVKGYTRVPGANKTMTMRPFTYLTPNVVLATGASDKPNIMNVPGENLPFVFHSLKDLERWISSGILNRDSDPVMVVGAGLCAADAIIAARSHNVPVLHVFRRQVNDPQLIFKQLPENTYPEYHQVYQMMRDPVGIENYAAFEEHVVSKVLPDRRVNLSGPTSCGTIKVSCLAVCTGNHPDLSFLSAEVESKLGVLPGLPVDCKRNPVAINFDSHESLHEPGLFALGPVVGENFVRFLLGGALAIANFLIRTQQSS